ncbi:N-acetyltransferase [Tardiphaga sp.]|uniref:GNAT family N-acetyltransferase n=1 Tax=Tardiphaga sp. TaxID=1926292 RepID=UPI002623B1B3|nr:N-acetyltransferase [Tardiphaga sp.]MDB5615945.1 GCN5-related N-acetyltransferase [Tardiphaga sp.]
MTTATTTALHQTDTDNTPAAAFAIREERAHDIAARETLLDVCFGVGRNARTCQRLRDGRVPAQGLAFSAMHQGRLVGSVRLWNVDAGDRRALVLGPLAVDASVRALGIGAALMNHAIAAAKALGHGAIILLGDEPYYARFGFAAAKAEGLSLPGPFERHRLLGLELRPGALNHAIGLIVPNGAAETYPAADQVAPVACAA